MIQGVHHEMWPSQRSFRSRYGKAAQRLFQKLDPRFQPQLFLAGIRLGSAARLPVVCIEPGHDFWLDGMALAHALSVAEQIGRERARMPSESPSASMRDHEFRGALQESLRRIVNTHPARPEDSYFAVSLPVQVDEFAVAAVVGLQQSLIEAYPALADEYVTLGEGRRLRVATSLVDAAMLEFLDRVSEQLFLPDPGRDFTNLDPDDLLRAAGQNLINGIVWRVDQERLDGMEHFASYCTNIASLLYEGRASAGNMLLARRHDPDLHRHVRFAQPIELSRIRQARKLIELTSERFSLHTDSEKVFGLVEPPDDDAPRQDRFGIRFVGHQHWELLYRKLVLMQVKFGLPALPEPPFDEDRLRADLPRLFRRISPEAVERLCELVKEAERQSHGTMLVITADAAREAKRLCVQGTPVEPCLLTPTLLRNLTPIDGAVILSPEGICHAIGTILDGKASSKGDPGRGARFNSAVRYVETSESPCLIVVVSEDGGVDLVPDLRPAIRRADIDQALSELGEFQTAMTVPRRRYAELVNWLNEHRFYLLESDCRQLNELVESIERRSDADRRAVPIASKPFAPHPEMDPALYYHVEA